jgi:hypothetical protein
MARGELISSWTKKYVGVICTRKLNKISNIAGMEIRTAGIAFL